MRVLGDAQSAIAPKFLIMGWFGNEEWIAKNPEAVKRFPRGPIQRTAVWANSHHEQSGEILLKYLKLSPETAKVMTARSTTRRGR